MKYLKETIQNEIVIEKSRFIAIIMPVTPDFIINDKLKIIKKEYPKANHYCYGTITGEMGQYQHSSDDGEPSGTAGIPILNVIKHHGITDIFCVVIRYFGGIKLGPSGLIRAYSNSTSEVINKAQFYKKKRVHLYKISFAYKDIDKIDYNIKEKETIIKKEFLDDVIYEVYFDKISTLDDIRYLLKSIEGLGDLILNINL